MHYVSYVPNRGLDANGRKLNWSALAIKVRKDKWLMLSLEEFNRITGSRAKTPPVMEMLPKSNGMTMQIKRRQSGKTLYLKWA